MPALHDRISLPVTQERIGFARRFLGVLMVVGLIAAPIEFVNDNLAVTFMGLLLGAVIPAILCLSTRPGRELWVVHFSLCLLMLFAVFSSVVNMQSLQNLLWLPLHPIILFYLGGVRIGSALSLLTILMHLAAYASQPWPGQAAPIPADQFTQLVMAFVTSTVLAYYYESTRTQHETQLRNLSGRDYLTGLDNRRGFFERATPLLAQARRLQQPYCVVLIDLDDFKMINDRFGHDAGDRVLVAAAETLRANSRAYDIAGRWGGEEFILLLPQCSGEGGWRLAETIRQALMEKALPHGLKVTASFGVAVCADGSEAFDAVVARADTHLYEAKQNGKNRVLPLLASPQPA
jgi:diguanylate cyclase (GGDEF)-like protein